MCMRFFYGEFGSKVMSRFKISMCGRCFFDIVGKKEAAGKKEIYREWVWVICGNVCVL